MNKFLIPLFVGLLASVASADVLKLSAGSTNVFDADFLPLGLELGIEYGLEMEDFTFALGYTSNAFGGKYAYANFQFPIKLFECLYLIPGIGGGYYTPGDAKDLGTALEFRTSMELAIITDDRYIFVGLSHLSNAGISAHNPGVEMLYAGIGWRFGLDDEGV